MNESDSIPNTPWLFSGETVVAQYGSDQKSGLSYREVEKRQKLHGRNEVKEVKQYTVFFAILRQVRSPLILILFLAAAATAFLGEMIDSIIILLAVAINAGLGFYQESKAEQAVEKLKSFITVRTRVVRDGGEHEIDAKEVVVGDIVHISYGSRVPADGRLLFEQGLRVDEAILTGESLPVEKGIAPCERDAVVSERTNMVYGGTLVTEGTGLMVVTAIAQATELGKIAQLVGHTSRERTPLQKTVATMAWFITVGITLLVVGVFLLGVARGEHVFEMFIVSIAVAVGAIPEALPIGLTAVLAVGVERLARRNGIMRNLSAAETLGSTTTVITDKTGTLTEASLQLVSIYPYHDLLSDKNAADAKETSELSTDQEHILYTAMVGTDVVVENPEEPPRNWRIAGSVLEATLVRSAAQFGLAFDDARRFSLAIPFSSSHKFSVSEGQFSSEEQTRLVIVGAPDVLLERAALSHQEYQQLHDRIINESNAGRRLVGVATMPSAPVGTALTIDHIKDVTFLGVIAFYDPVRKEVPEAIRRIEQFGVRVVIATGDLPGTATAVASKLGWTVRPEEIVTGSSLAAMDDETLRALLPTVRIFARVTPSDKLRVARLFQAKGEVVAMTGDGVNDAPSLKAVDIGIALGSGSDVAKGVADLVLLDDNFNTIVLAIEEGKRVLANIRKTFVYLMSNSLDEIFLIGGSLIMGLAMPLSAMQIIWVNFFTGSLPAVAFAFDTAVGQHRHSKPESIISHHVLRLTLVIGIVISGSLFVLYYLLSETDLPQDQVKTFIFVCFAAYILVISYSLRNLRKPLFTYRLFDNKVLNYGVIFGLLLTVISVYFPYLQGILETVALPLVWWSGVILWLLYTILFVELSKWVSHRLQ